MNETKPSAKSEAIGLAVMALILLWIGGWRVAIGEAIYTKRDLFIGHGVAVKFNSQYYGFLFDNRLFDSPVVSWALAFLAVGALGWAIETATEQKPKTEN